MAKNLKCDDVSEQPESGCGCTLQNDGHSRRTWHLPVLLLGLILPQLILLWPSLSGSSYLLPLNILGAKANYLPASWPGIEPGGTWDKTLTDALSAVEPFRYFAAQEVRAGRWPLWNPYTYCGTPFLANGQSAVFSPWSVLSYLWPSPAILAWQQLLKCVVAGLGLYLFLRQSWRLSFWSSAIGAWVFPLCGFLMFWYSYPLSCVAVWFPWMLWSVHFTVKKPRGPAGIGLAVVTGAMLVSGHAAMAGQLMLAAGIYGLWCIFDIHLCAKETWNRRLGNTLIAGLVLSLGWGLGFLLASPQLLPMVEYLQESYRIKMRVTGNVETPPVGWGAIPQMLVPCFYGTTRSDTVFLAPGNWVESPAAAYVGMVMALLFVPLAWSDKQRRRSVIFWSLLGLFAASFTLNIPGLVEIFKYPPLNLFRNNRFVFITGVAILLLGATGLESLRQKENLRSRWMVLAMLLLSAMAVVCVYRAMVLPPKLLEIFKAIQQSMWQNERLLPPFDGRDGIERVTKWFTTTYLLAGFWCIVALGLVGFSWLRRSNKVILIALPLLMLAEIFTFATMGYFQFDRALYFPDLPIFSALRSHGPGRICGVNCYPPNLCMMQHIPDIRGYDAADPYRMIELCQLFENPITLRPLYAQTQWFVPRYPSRLADMLNMRYILGRGLPPQGVHPDWQRDDFWILENPRALPRVFVPQRVEVVNDDKERLARLGDANFDPRDVALVESDEPMPLTAVQGDGEIVSEIPCQVTIQLHMQTPGMVVIADRYDKGWKAFINGKAMRVFQVNHALRGVIAPAGESLLEYRYEPASFFLGLRLAAGTSIFLLAWAGVIFWIKPGASSVQT